MIPREQLADYLDDALDGARRTVLDLELETDAEALRFVVEQQSIERALRSVHLPAARRQRLKQSVLAAITAKPTEKLRARVLAEIAGDRPIAPVRSRTTNSPHGVTSRDPRGGILEWIARNWRHVLGLGAGVKAPAWSLAALATVGLVFAIGLWVANLEQTSRLGAQVGVLAEVVGTPALRRGQGLPAIEPARGTPVRLGDRLETGDADRAEIRFHDGTTLRLAFNTAIELPSGTTSRQSSSIPMLRPAEVLLRQGHVWTKVAKQTNAPAYAIRTDAATAIARGTEFGVRLQRVAGAATNPALAAVLTVKEGTVEFLNAFGSVQATAQTESTARADSAPTEPRRLDTLQTVSLATGATWSLVTSPLDETEAASRLAVGGGVAGWHLLELLGTNGFSEIRLGQLNSRSPAARAGLRVGDTLTTLEGHPLTNTWQLTASVLLQPQAPLNLRVRRATGDEPDNVALVIAVETNLLHAPALSAADRTALHGLLRRWLSEPANPNPDAAAESQRFEQAAALSRRSKLRAAAFNQLGVAYELADALGPAIRAYGRACYVEPTTPLYHFNLALALRKIGSFERAHEELREVVRLQPESVPARMRLAEVTSLMGQHDEALALATTLLQAAPEDHATLELQAQLLIKLQRPADAVAPARRAAELDPDCPVAHSYLAEALHDAGKLEEALAAWNEALERAPFEAGFLVNLGTLQRDLGQPDAAERSFRQAIARNPGFSLAHRNIGEALAARREFAAAAEAMDQARKLDPNDSVAHWRLGDMLLEGRQFDQAERTYREALEVTPNSAEAWYGLGEAHRLRNRSADAEQAYRRAIELQRSYAAAYTALGIVLYDRGDVDEAERLYRRALELNPKASAPCNNLGTLYRENRGDLDAAERWFRKATELSPGDGEPVGGLGLVAEERGDLPAAERLLRHAVELTPQSSALQNNLGEVLRRRGRPDEAEQLYRKALELDPDNPAPYGNLGVLQAERKQFAEAERTFRALLDRSTGNARLPALINLAMVLGEQGKLEPAERLLRDALDLAPRNPRVTSGLASFLADHRIKLDEALDLATRAVRSAPNDVEFLDALGWVQAQRGDLDAAERTLQRALELAGRETPAIEVRKHLERTRERMQILNINKTTPTP